LFQPGQTYLQKSAAALQKKTRLGGAGAGL
jgi:hypothetical protein